MDLSGPSSAQQETGIQETVNPHAEEVKSLAINPEAVDQHAALEMFDPKVEPSDKPSEPTKLPGIITFTGNSGFGGTNAMLC